MKERNIAASIHAQLLALAHAQKRSMQELLLYYAIERFLYRLSVSPHADRFVLKGGLLLRVWDAPHSRPTKDIDFLCYAGNDVDDITATMREVCQLNDTEDGLIFDTKTVVATLIKKDADYHGVRLKFVGRLGKAALPMQIDIGFGDTVVPAPSKLAYPTLLNHEAPQLRAYPPETVIAEKFEAMVALGLLNSRMKDFYDVWLLSQTQKFDAAVLARAIKTTFDNRKRPLDVSPIAFTSEFFDGEHATRQWTAFKRNAKLDHMPESLSAVVALLRAFLLPVVAHLLGGSSPGSWSVELQWT